MGFMGDIFPAFMFSLLPFYYAKPQIILSFENSCVLVRFPYGNFPLRIKVQSDKLSNDLLPSGVCFFSSHCCLLSLWMENGSRAQRWRAEDGV